MEHYLSKYDYISYAMFNIALDFNVLPDLYNFMLENNKIPKDSDVKKF